MCDRVDTAALTYKGPRARLAPGWRPRTWISGEFSPFSNNKGGSLCLSCLYKQCGYARCLVFCWEPGILLSASCLRGQSPVNTLGTEPLMSFPGRRHSASHCDNLLQAEFSMICVTPLGEDSWMLVFGFLWSLSHVPFPFADFALYPSAVIILALSTTTCWVL